MVDLWVVDQYVSRDTAQHMAQTGEAKISPNYEALPEVDMMWQMVGRVEVWGWRWWCGGWAVGSGLAGE